MRLEELTSVPDKAKPFERRARKAAGLMKEDGRAAEGISFRCTAFFIAYHSQKYKDINLNYKEDKAMKKFLMPYILLMITAILIYWCPAQASPVSGYALEFIGNGSVAAINSSGAIAANEIVTVDGTRTYMAWVAESGSPLVYLPVPEGLAETFVTDLNDNGVAVGAAIGDDFVRHAIAWFPDGTGGYDIFDLAALLGSDSTDSYAVAINNNDVILGSSIEPNAVNLLTSQPFYHSATAGIVRIMGFPHYPTDINDTMQIVGGNKRMDLITNAVEDLGFPDTPNMTGHVFISMHLAAVNNNGSAVGQGALSTSLHDNAAIARYSDLNGWDVLTGGSRYPAAFDINNNEDVTFSSYYFCLGSAVHFEGEGTFCISSLLIDTSWSVSRSIAMINDSQQIAAYAENVSLDLNGVVRLSPAGDFPLPDAPTDLTATLQPENNLYPNGLIKVEWTNPNEHPVTIEVERKPGPNGETDFTGIRLSGNGTDGILSPLSLDTTYTYRARACGLAGCSDYSNEASATTPAVSSDTIAPVVSFVSPGSGEQVSGNVQVTVNAVDNVSMHYISITYSLSGGGSSVCTVYFTETAECGWQTKRLQPGAYTLKALGVDHVGNYTQESISVEVIESSGGGSGKGGGNGKGKGRNK